MIWARMHQEIFRGKLDRLKDEWKIVINQTLLDMQLYRDSASLVS
jgi:hypothetical protein